MNAPLIDALKSDSSMILWFRHNDGKGCYLNDFYLSRKFQQETMEGAIPKCSGCGRKQGEEHIEPATFPVVEVKREGLVDLKMCSRCKKVFYCSKECQKKNYRVHKRYCLTLHEEAKENEIEVKQEAPIDGKVINKFI